MSFSLRQPRDLVTGAISEIEPTEKCSVAQIIAQASECEAGPMVGWRTTITMRHLVAAILDCKFGTDMKKHGLSTRSESKDVQSADFLIGDTAIHVAASPFSGVVERCQENIKAGLIPVIITADGGISLMRCYAESLGVAERIDVFGIEQFAALHVYKAGRFTKSGQQAAFGAVIERYNAIISSDETEP